LLLKVLMEQSIPLATRLEKWEVKSGAKRQRLNVRKICELGITHRRGFFLVMHVR